MSLIRRFKMNTNFYSDKANLGLLALAFGGTVTLLFGLPFLHSQPDISIVGGSVTIGSIALLALKESSSFLKQKNSPSLQGRVTEKPSEQKDPEDARIQAVLEYIQDLPSE